MRVLITGGAGFIGSHLADELLAHGYAVRVLDCLESQVHGANAQRPDYLADEVELLRGDVREPAAVHRALQNVDAVFHFAAMVGKVGASWMKLGRKSNILISAVASPASRTMPTRTTTWPMLRMSYRCPRN